MRGSAPRKCSLDGTRPRPGRPTGTRAATLRSTSESSGSPRRSSSLEPKTSRIAARKSAHRVEAVTMWRPKVRPRAASCWISISRSSNSARSVLQPSMTRKTSPQPSSARPWRTARAVGLDRVDAVLAEVGLAPVDDALDLGDHTAYDVGLGAGRDTGDVREAGQRRERAAAEVEHEELRLHRRRHQRHARDDGAQQRALARARTADDGDVAGRAGEVERHRVAALLARPVDGAERDHQARDVAPLRETSGRGRGPRRGRA